MAKYLCGPSVLRFEGRPDPVQPGDAFEQELSAEQESVLIAAGAIAIAAQAVEPAVEPEAVITSRPPTADVKE